MAKNMEKPREPKIFYDKRLNNKIKKNRGAVVK